MASVTPVKAPSLVIIEKADISLISKRQKSNLNIIFFIHYALLIEGSKSVKLYLNTWQYPDTP